VRLLIVDDDTYMRLLCSLEFPEFDILEAAGVRDGLNIVADDRPDFVLIDRRLKDGDGLDLLRKMRELHIGGEVPVVVVSAGFSEEDRVEVMHAGADDYVAKPLDAATLRRILSDLEGLSPDTMVARRQQILAKLAPELFESPPPAAGPGPGPGPATPAAATDGPAKKRRISQRSRPLRARRPDDS
jgi:DNA-binding response OmpR family regulator